MDILNFDCFRLILAKTEIALQELVQLRIVNKYWKLMIEKMLQEKSSLKLFGSKTDVLSYCITLASYTIHESTSYSHNFNLKKIGQDDDLIGKDSLDSNCHFLPFLFPNVKKLTIGYADLAKLDVAFLLSNWNLEYLTVRHDNLPKSVWSAVKLHKSLKVLNFFNDAHQENADHLKFPKLKLPVLQQLEQFSFVKYEGDMFPILRQLGPNLKHLIFGEIHSFTSQWQHLFTIKPDLALSLTHLTVFNINPLNDLVVQNEFIELVCTCLTSLTYLNLIDFQLIPIENMITQYARLPKLSEVYFYPSGKHQNLNKAAGIANKLPKLELVKVLHVSLDDNFFGAFFPVVFPNVEVLNVKSGNSMIGLFVKKEVHKFIRLRKFSYLSVQRHERCLAFTGRHAKDYDEFLYVRHLNWSYNPLQQQNPLDECVIS